VSKGTWESFHREDWAHEEDRWLEKTPLVQLDQEFVNEHLPGPTNGATERVADLGCGAGRVTLALARAGYSVLAVDLSQPMLDKVQVTVAAEELSVECLKSNLVHLDAISSDFFNDRNDSWRRKSTCGGKRIPSNSDARRQALVTCPPILVEPSPIWRPKVDGATSL
jgi:SAM-dependent methyltransferase